MNRTTWKPRKTKAQREAIEIMRLAARIRVRLAARYEDYLAECASYREDGYAPHYCEHGTNNWTDYDNICGGCENGYTNATPLDRLRNSLDEARERHARMVEMRDALTVMRDIGATTPETEMLVWEKIARTMLFTD